MHMILRLCAKKPVLVAKAMKCTLCKFNTYKPRVPFLCQNAASDQGLHCLLTGISI